MIQRPVYFHVSHAQHDDPRTHNRRRLPETLGWATAAMTLVGVPSRFENNVDASGQSLRSGSNTKLARGDFVTKAANRPIPSLHLTGTCDGETPGVELVNRGPSITTYSPVSSHSGESVF
jgi:hypothetical protein